MKTGIFRVVLFVGLVLLLTMYANKCSSSLETELNKYETRVGDKVILKGDTLMIIDYSFMESNFTLEDGRKVSIELLDRCNCMVDNVR